MLFNSFVSLEFPELNLLMLKILKYFLDQTQTYGIAIKLSIPYWMLEPSSTGHLRYIHN